MSRSDLAETRRRISVVAVREMRARGGRAFRISTVAAIVLVVALIALPALLGKTTTYRLGLAGDVRTGTVTALTAQAKAAGRQIKVSTYDSVAAGEQAVRDQKVDALLVDGKQLEWRGKADSALSVIVASAVQAVHVRDQARQLGISDAQLTRLLVPATITSKEIGTSRTANEDANAVGIIAIVLLMMAISVYGGFVLTAVVQEKANRVSEVLLARMPAREILAGKVLGIGALGLGQFAVIVVTAEITVQALGGDAPDVPGAVLAWTVAWFVLGYAFYSVAYAAVGATTSRIEDAQAAAAPLSLLLIGGYVAGLFAQANPDTPVTTLLSFLPPTAPVVMPLRVALDVAPVWQLVGSAIVTLVVIWGLVRVAGRIYTGGLLRFGTRVPLREAWRSAG